MGDFHGIIFAYSSPKPLRDLVRYRTAASIPFCGRYRVIDFALSSLMNAGIRDVGVIMQRDYQSLLDHLGSGKAWDMSLKRGGLRILPPFGIPEYHAGRYSGTMEALNGVHAYVEDIPEKNVILLQGNMCANFDLSAAMAQHLETGADITAIVSDHPLAGVQHKYTMAPDGTASQLLLESAPDAPGLTSLEGYIFTKEKLLELMEKAREEGLYLFHKDVMGPYMRSGGKVHLYVHHGYAASIRSIETYCNASFDMLDSEKFFRLFPADRPIVSKAHEDVSTYYGEKAQVSTSLISDGCIIEGEIENCIISSDVTVGKGAKLKNCIIMRGCKIGENAVLTNVVSDKNVIFPEAAQICGTRSMPVIIPRDSVL